MRIVTSILAFCYLMLVRRLHIMWSLVGAVAIWALFTFATRFIHF
jgi:hypothetical protein